MQPHTFPFAIMAHSWQLMRHKFGLREKKYWLVCENMLRKMFLLSIFPPAYEKCKSKGKCEGKQDNYILAVHVTILVYVILWPMMGVGKIIIPQSNNIDVEAYLIFYLQCNQWFLLLVPLSQIVASCPIYIALSILLTELIPRVWSSTWKGRWDIW